MRIFRTFFTAIRPFMRGIDVRIDRQNQTVTFERNGQVEILTVDQLFNEIESMFARPGAPQDANQRRVVPMVWLTNCDHPIAEPLKMIDQALTEPTRPLAARQA